MLFTVQINSIKHCFPNSNHRQTIRLKDIDRTLTMHSLHTTHRAQGTRRRLIQTQALALLQHRHEFGFRFWRAEQKTLQLIAAQGA